MARERLGSGNGPVTAPQKRAQLPLEGTRRDRERVAPGIRDAVVAEDEWLHAYPSCCLARFRRPKIRRWLRPLPSEPPIEAQPR